MTSHPEQLIAAADRAITAEAIHALMDVYAEGMQRCREAKA